MKVGSAGKEKGWVIAKFQVWVAIGFFLALCRDMDFRVATWSSSQAHDSAWVRSTGVHAIELFGSMSRKGPSHCNMVAGMLGRLGRDKGFLCRDRAFF